MTVLTPAELRNAIQTLGWSRAELGERTFSHRNTVNRWVNTGPVPGPVAAYINLSLEIRKLAALTTPSPRQ